MSDHDVVVLETGSVAAGGGCVARGDDGRVVFVRHALPGERVRAVITEEQRSYLRADAIEVLSASPHRVDPPCPHAGAGRCGGCDLQHVALPEQRRWKSALIEEQMRRIAHLERAVAVEPVPGDEDGLAWRTRVRFGVDADGRLGLRRHRSHELERIDRCRIAAPSVHAVGVEHLHWPQAAEVEVFGASVGADAIVSVFSGEGELRDLPHLEAGIVADGRVLRAPRTLEFRVLSRRFSVSPGSFWQVHPGAATALARAVLEGLQPAPGEEILDLYSGVGLFSALIGEVVGRRGRVLGIERDARACADARRNSADQPQVEILTANVTRTVIAQRAIATAAVVLDPTRDGAGRAVMTAIAALKPKRVVSVSCDPASFARDLGVLLDEDWTVRDLRAFDIFPMTEHVEIVAVLEPPSA